MEVAETCSLSVYAIFGCICSDWALEQPSVYVQIYERWVNSSC